MAKETFIDWQKDSLLVASAGGRPGNAKVDACSLKKLGEGQAATAVLTDAVNELNLAKTTATVVLSRGKAEVRTISVPRIDSDELPDVIRFQAQRQLANMTDSWSLDFVLLPDVGGEMQTALVAAVSPSDMNAVNAACTAAGLQLSRVVLRPLEIARHALAHQSGLSGAALVVCVTDDEADLILTNHGKILLLRNTRLPHESDSRSKALAGEIRRSMVAASGQLGSTQVTDVILLSSGDIGSTLQAPLHEATGAQVHYLDIAESLPADATSQALALDAGNRVAGICGSVALSHAAKDATIDFKNPKKRPPKKKNTLSYILGGLAAAAVLIAAGSWWVNTNRSLTDELELLEAENESKKTLVESAKKKSQELALVEQFGKASPNYLDEFAHLASRIPEANKIILAGPTFTTLSNGDGKMTVRIAADSAESISSFEDSLRDENHIVLAREPRLSRSPTELYKWEATEQVEIRNRGWDLTAAPTSSSPEADDSSDEVSSDGESTTEDNESSSDSTSDEGGESSNTDDPAPSSEAKDEIAESGTA